jgi:hypothetical protein
MLEFISVEEGQSCLDNLDSCPLGDMNDDGNYNVLDIVALANCVLGSNCAELENGCAGDLNGDGNYNVLDIVALANCVLGSNCFTLENSCAGDINGDGNYNVLDIVALVNCVLGSNCSDLGRLNDTSGMSFFKAQAKWID